MKDTRSTRLSLALAVAGLAVLALAAPASAADRSPFDGNAMWIWQLPRAQGGNLAAIVRRARASKVKALFIKSADGPVNDWRQFTPSMIAYFKSNGFKVCGWHYVYGRSPAAEAQLSANAIRDGADCLIIDAEAQYEGRYAAADTYMTTLRQLVGDTAPIALAGFPYVDYHPSFPYSVFLRPGGAQYSMPQMYWRAIGTSVDNVFAHTFRWNQPYGRPIFPLGQIWQNPPLAQVRRFRQLASAYGAAGVSWWEWSQAGSRVFKATGGQPLAAATPRGVDSVTIGPGSRGDWVVWAQEHLNGAGSLLPVTGYYGSQTQAAVLGFQAAKGLPATGAIDPATWRALLDVQPASTPWASIARRARARSATAASATATTGAPASARLPSEGNELAGRRR
jgi:putative peptidoglycan binding protein